jgi:hypothetical protein
VRAAQAGQAFDVDLYSGPDEARETYVYSLAASAESLNDWVPVQVRWEDFRRAGWEENAGAAFAKPGEVAGLAFGLNSQEAPNVGELWVDDLQLSGAVPLASQAEPEGVPTTAPENVSEDQLPRGPSLPCAGTLVLPILLLGFTFRKR